MLSPKFILSGGGTGGHIFPAVAIANALKAEYPSCEILFVGANGRMEMEKVPAAGYKIIGLNIRGLKRSFSVSNITLPFAVLKAVRTAGKIIADFKPTVAIGVGGYASGALLFMAARKGIPCLIQEQNSFAGITNKLLGKRVKTICVAYDGMEKFFPASKIVVTGNPVRQDILDAKVSKAEAKKYFDLDENKTTLLVVGGSLGAKSINDSILNALPQFKEAGIQLIWQTGKPFAADAMAGIKNLHVKGFTTHAFIKEMDVAYAAADLVVSRAGALAVAELSLLGKASILIPYPFASEDHQTMNAKALADKNAAVLIPDAEAFKRVPEEVLRLVANDVEREALASSIKDFARPGATRAIIDEINKLMKN
ncbi:MAG: undecaprenyldiphospho-muramoylpentapeptide beta-N-acetylglucosaminyltransferase [Bacteroidia bacterium]